MKTTTAIPTLTASPNLAADDRWYIAHAARNILAWGHTDPREGSLEWLEVDPRERNSCETFRRVERVRTACGVQHTVYLTPSGGFTDDRQSALQLWAASIPLYS